LASISVTVLVWALVTPVFNRVVVLGFDARGPGFQSPVVWSHGLGHIEVEVGPLVS